MCVVSHVTYHIAGPINSLAILCMIFIVQDFLFCFCLWFLLGFIFAGNKGFGVRIGLRGLIDPF